MEYNLWLSKVGRDRSTGYRWVAKGMVTTINIQGRLYITSGEIARFWARAAAGEFSKVPMGFVVNQVQSLKGPIERLCRSTNVDERAVRRRANR